MVKGPSYHTYFPERIALRRITAPNSTKGFIDKVATSYGFTLSAPIRFTPRGIIKLTHATGGGNIKSE